MAFLFMEMTDIWTKKLFLSWNDLKRENINQIMITLTSFFQWCFNMSDSGLKKTDHINRMIKSTVIIVSSFYCLIQINIIRDIKIRRKPWKGRKNPKTSREALTATPIRRRTNFQKRCNFENKDQIQYTKNVLSLH